MKQIILKNFRVSESLAIIIPLILGFILIIGLLLPEIANTQQPIRNRVLFLCILFVVSLCLGLLIFCLIRSIQKFVIITENGLLYMAGKKILRYASKEEIIAYGCISTYRKDFGGNTFFCFSKPETVTACAMKNWQLRKRLYRPRQSKELETTLSGIWILQMSIYISLQGWKPSKSRSVILLNGTSKDTLHKIEELWQRKPMLLGSMALYNPWNYL